MTYTFNTLRDLFENYAQLREMGVMPYWGLHHGITISLYYADPDGNRMEFQVDACTIDEANAFMKARASSRTRSAWSLNRMTSWRACAPANLKVLSR